MNAGAKLGAFALLLGVALGGGAAIGAAVGPIDVGADEHGADHAADRDIHEDGSPTPTSAASVDGYDLTLEGDLVPGEESEVVVRVSRDDAPIETDLHLGAAGHLVVLPDGDLGRLRADPVDSDDGSVRFVIDVPSPGTYTLYFDFLHDDTVRTARFVANTDHGHG